MGKKVDFFEIDTNDSEIQNIKKAMKETKNKRMYQRYMVILYHLQGYTNKHIADIMDLCAHTVGTYIKKYKIKGISELEIGHSTGVPRKLNSEQEKKLVEIVTTKTPDEVGFEPRKNWAVAIIKQWVIDNFNVNYSPRGMAEVVYRLNLIYTRPTYTMAKADSKKQEVFKTEFDVLKKSY